MPRNYYYLVAGLPEIAIEGNKNVPSMAEFIEDTAAQVHEDDAKLLEAMRYPIDNKNALALLNKDATEFDIAGNYEQAELEAELKAPDILPPYLEAFADAWRAEISLFAGLTREDELNRLFYEEMANHPNCFIRQWYEFDLNLRNVLTALNCRSTQERDNSADYEMTNAIIGRNDVAEQLLKSNAPDFSLGPVFPWVERIHSFSQEDLVDTQKGIDELRWEFVNELTSFDIFRIETILAFALKLGIVDRWLDLDPETGKQHLDRLVSELESGFHLSNEL
ncbi:MAG: DUF2764 family protein [Chitinivibrionales bacterium]|nr:DUF2764 family protein [Chitinivibrionales bacterium]